jgi:hypothetical protein
LRTKSLPYPQLFQKELRGLDGGVNEPQRQAGLPVKRRTILVAAAWLMTVPCAGDQAAVAKGQDTPTIAIAAFDYHDSSGEPVDQQARHQQLLVRFADTVRDRLAEEDGGSPVELQCPAAPCSAGHLPADQLLASAKEADADLLLYGGVHKMSTLVQWIRVEVVDLARNELVLARTLTFRGDSDAAWDHAANYVSDLLRDWLADRGSEASGGATAGKP